MSRSVSHLFLVLAVEDLELAAVLFEPLNADDLTDRLLLILAAFEEIAGHERGEESLILGVFPVPDIEAVDDQEPLLGLALLVEFDDRPLLLVFARN